MERLFALLAAATAVPLPQLATPPPPAATAPAGPDELVFTEEQQRMTVPVEVAGAGPYRFIIDTGAQRSVVSHQLARRLGLAPGPRVRLTDMSGTASVGTVIVPSLRVSTLGGERIEAPALDAVDLGAPGMLGIDTLQGHALAIDFDRQTMAVTPARRRGTFERHDPDEIVIRAKSMFGQLVVTDAAVNGRRVRVVLDTGTAVSVGNSALRRLLARDKRGPITFTTVLGNAVTAELRPITSLKLGDAEIANLTMAFADTPPFRAFGLEKRPALLLGMDALKLFRRVDIDFANHELRLTMPRGVRRGLL